MWAASVLVALILITAKRELWVTSAAFVVIAIVWTRIAFYTYPNDPIDPPTQRELFEALTRNYLYQFPSVQLPCCKYVIQDVNRAILFHPLSNVNRCRVVAVCSGSRQSLGKRSSSKSRSAGPSLLVFVTALHSVGIPGVLRSMEAY